LSIAVLLISMLFASFVDVNDVLDARDHPLNRLLVHIITPRGGLGTEHLWTDEELSSTANLLETRRQLTSGGGWKVLRAEFLAWEERHRNDYGPTACMEFEWAPTAILRLYGKDTALLDEFPETKRLLEGVAFTSFSFYTLAPHAQLHPHRGVTSFLLRYHLGIVVPTYDLSSASEDGGDGDGNVLNPHLSLCADDPELVLPNAPPGDFLSNECSSYRHYNWKEGRDFVFDDNSVHKAKNPGGERRVVLLADFLRPNIRPRAAAWGLGFLVEHVIKRIPEVSKYAESYSRHYEELVGKRRDLDTRQKGCVFDALNMRDDGGWDRNELTHAR
jgi:hypothetical protein